MEDTSKVWNFPMKRKSKVPAEKHWLKESYLVKYWFQKPDGYWESTVKEVFLTGDSKDQHEKAWETLRDSLRGTPCKLINITYV